jgi:uncharacterized protein
VDRSQSQPQTLHGTGLASDSVAVATVIIYHFAKIKARLFFIDMKTLEEIKQTLRETKPLLQEQYRVTQLGVFGSYARGEQTQTSDVDILIDYDQAPTLFKLVELRDYLAEVVGMKVDVVTKNGLKPRIQERVLSEVVYI